MWGKIIIPMYRLWLYGLYGLYGPRCPLFAKRPINLISLSFWWRSVILSHIYMNYYFCTVFGAYLFIYLFTWSLFVYHWFVFLFIHYIHFQLMKKHLLLLLCIFHLIIFPPHAQHPSSYKFIKKKRVTSHHPRHTPTPFIRWIRSPTRCPSHEPRGHMIRIIWLRAYETGKSRWVDV